MLLVYATKEHNQKNCRTGAKLVSINPFMPNGIPHFYQLDQFISVLRGVGCFCF